MARGHRLNTSIVLAAVHGLSGLFRAVSAVEHSLFRPLYPPPPIPVPNKQPRVCGRNATWSFQGSGTHHSHGQRGELPEALSRTGGWLRGVAVVGDGDQQSHGLGLPAETLPLACGAAGSHQRGAGRRPPDRVSTATKRVIFVEP